MGPVWERSSDVPYPKVWLEFEAKDSKDSDKLVKYRIQDLPENRFDDAVQHIIEHFLIDAPVSKFFGAATNEAYVEDYLRSCRRQIKARTSLVCFREGSDDIVGLNITYVTTENDTFWTEMRELADTQEYKDHMEISKIIRGNSSVFKKYGADKCLGCICLSVDPAYRGLKIGQRLLEARKPFCEAFNIPVTQSFFTSDQSNYMADKLGFEFDSGYTLDELNTIFTKYRLGFETSSLSYKSLNFKKENQCQQ